MENKTYEIEIDGRIIPVTTKEVLDFYPKEYRHPAICCRLHCPN
jgi:hypothetical protein